MHWKRNVLFVWLSQFFSIMGFAFALPFTPFYLQELGVTDPIQLRIWVAAVAAATPVSMAIFSPLWGLLADCYSRRIMLVRANLAGCLVLVFMGLIQTPGALVVLRLVQGVFTGTVTAAQAMVAGEAPAHRSGLALGTLTAALYSGSMTGSFIGGLVSFWLGYRKAFMIAGSLLAIATLLVLLGTRESPPVTVKKNRMANPPAQQLTGAMGWVFILLTVMAFARQFDMAYVPLLAQEIFGRLDGISVWSGWLFAIGGVAGLLSGVWMGHLSDRWNMRRLGLLTALGAAVLTAAQGLAHGFGVLFPVRFGTVLCAGALEPIFQSWLAKHAPAGRHGVVFGLAGTARSVGWALAPILAGVVAACCSLRTVFWVAGGVFALLALAIAQTKSK